MSLYIISFFVFLLVILAMAVGVIFSGRRIQGSCGGLGNVVVEEDGSRTCLSCGASFEGNEKLVECLDPSQKTAKS